MIPSDRMLLWQATGWMTRAGSRYGPMPYEVLDGRLLASRPAEARAPVACRRQQRDAPFRRVEGGSRLPDDASTMCRLERFGRAAHRRAGA
jgi:hypothetical protein